MKLVFIAAYITILVVLWCTVGIQNGIQLGDWHVFRTYGDVAFFVGNSMAAIAILLQLHRIVRRYTK